MHHFMLKTVVLLSFLVFPYFSFGQTVSVCKDAYNDNTGWDESTDSFNSTTAVPYDSWSRRLFISFVPLESGILHQLAYPVHFFNEFTSGVNNFPDGQSENYVLSCKLYEAAISEDPQADSADFELNFIEDIANPDWHTQSVGEIETINGTATLFDNTWDLTRQNLHVTAGQTYFLSVWANRSQLSLAFIPLIAYTICLLYTSPSPRDATLSRMPSSA